MKAFIVILTILYYPRTKGADIEANCELNKCYDSVNSSHAKLRTLVNEGQPIIESAKFPSTAYLNISSLLNKTVDIGIQLHNIQVALDNDVLNLDRCYENYTVNTEFLKDLLNKLQIASNNTQLVEILNLVADRLKYFKKAFSVNQNASSMCGNATDDYLQFESIVNDLFNDFQTIKDQINQTMVRIKSANKDSDSNFQNTITNLDQFNELRILQDIADNYVSEAEANIDKILYNLQDSKNTLYDYLKDLYKNRSGEVEKRVQELRAFVQDLQNTVTIIEKNLLFYDAAISKNDVFSILSVNKFLIKEIAANIEALIKKIEIFEISFELVQQEFQQKRDRVFKVIKERIASVIKERKTLAQYGLFLDFLLLSEDRIRMIEAEIRKTEYTIALINQKKQMEVQLDEVKKIYDELVKHQVDGICRVNVTFEN